MKVEFGLHASIADGIDRIGQIDEIVVFCGDVIYLLASDILEGDITEFRGVIGADLNDVIVGVPV